MSNRGLHPPALARAAVSLDESDRLLLNEMQAGIPIVERPYRALGERVGLSESEVLSRVDRLRAVRVIRQIGGIFDTTSLGYQSTLVAARCPADRLETAAAIINAHPGVTHNYERNHAFNLWYTVAVPPASDLRATVECLHALSAVETSRILPALRVFKIGVNFDVTGTRTSDARDDTPSTPRAAADTRSLTGIEVALVRALQDDLPAVGAPFRPIAERVGCTESALFEHIADLIQTGRCRRFAAILHHRRVGFAANAMGVWNVASDRTDEVGRQMAAFASVSHCYERPSYPDWPYRLFTMVHGHSTTECEETLAAIARRTGIAEYRALYSRREFKKTRLRFFDGATERWEMEHLVGAHVS